MFLVYAPKHYKQIPCTVSENLLGNKTVSDSNRSADQLIVMDYAFRI